MVSLEIEKLCKQLNFETFLPHKDVGLYKELKDIKEISKKDIEELHKCDILVGVLDGVCVGAGTSWEMGYFQALGKSVIGLKTDRKINESISDISVVVAGAVNIVESLKELKKELLKIKNMN